MRGTQISPMVDFKAGDYIQAVTDRIVREFAPLRIVLFESWARGDARLDSDLDILVVMPDGTPKRATRLAIGNSLTDVPVPMDIIVTSPDELRRYGDAVGMILRPALREGKILYDSDIA
jgi:predicted nucleotidyltransferase